MENARILVIGGNGYIGQEIVAKLLDKKYAVTILSRGQPKIKGAYFVNGNALDISIIKRLVDKNDIIIYLAAVVQTVFKSKYRENVAGAKIIAEIMSKYPKKKLVYFSTQNVSLHTQGAYSNSKKEAENIIRNSKANYLIIKPNYVYGIDTKNNFFHLARIMKRFNICPLVAGGKALFQPINKEDVADATLSCIKRFRMRSTIELSGTITISIKEASVALARDSKLKPLFINIPAWLLYLIKPFVPFDIASYSEDRISSSRYLLKKPHRLYEDFKKITSLL